MRQGESSDRKTGYILASLTTKQNLALLNLRPGISDAFFNHFLVDEANTTRPVGWGVVEHVLYIKTQSVKATKRAKAKHTYVNLESAVGLFNKLVELGTKHYDCS